MEYTIREYTTYKENEILALYADIGWTAYTDQPELLKKGFENSLLTLAAYDQNRLVGILRAVGDGYTIIFIQDILVLSEYQRKGIGSRLIQAVLERFQNVRQIELATDNTPKTIAFYKAQGFQTLGEVGCCGFMKI